MKYFYLAFTSFFLLSSCGKDIHPEKVFDAYLADVQQIENLSDFPFSSYLSIRAQEFTAVQMNRAGITITDFSMAFNGNSVEIGNIVIESSSVRSEEMSSIFLKMWKSEANMPTEYKEKWQLDDKTAKWRFLDEKFLDPDTQLEDSTLETVVHFVYEAGWKIDKIKRTRTSKDGSTIKSTTY